MSKHSDDHRRVCSLGLVAPLPNSKSVARISKVELPQTCQISIRPCSLPWHTIDIVLLKLFWVLTCSRSSFLRLVHTGQGHLSQRIRFHIHKFQIEFFIHRNGVLTHLEWPTFPLVCFTRNRLPACFPTLRSTTFTLASRAIGITGVSCCSLRSDRRLLSHQLFLLMFDHCALLTQNNTQAESKMDTKTAEKQYVQLNSTRLTQATVIHNLCRDQHEVSAPLLVCARSGYLHTICSGRHTKKRISSLHLKLSSHDTRPSFHTNRIDRAAVQTILADLISAIPHHSQ